MNGWFVKTQRSYIPRKLVVDVLSELGSTPTDSVRPLFDCPTPVWTPRYVGVSPFLRHVGSGMVRVLDPPPIPKSSFPCLPVLSPSSKSMKEESYIVLSSVQSVYPTPSKGFHAGIPTSRERWDDKGGMIVTVQRVLGPALPSDITGTYVGSVCRSLSVPVLRSLRLVIGTYIDPPV